MNTDDDVADRLFAAFTNHQQVSPQLMADAHAEIVRLRRETAQLARAVDDTERAAHAAKLAQLDRDTSRQIAAAIAAERRQHTAVVSAMRNARRLAERRAERAEEFYRTVAPLVRDVAARRQTAKTPALVDSLLLRTVRHIDAAARRYNAPAPARQLPEGISA